jgi:hypothetical protein
MLMNFPEEGLRVKAGCRNFSVDKARQHWRDTRGGTHLGDESQALIEHMLNLARMRGWDCTNAKSEAA